MKKLNYFTKMNTLIIFTFISMLLGIETEKVLFYTPTTPPPTINTLSKNHPIPDIALENGNLANISLDDIISTRISGNDEIIKKIAILIPEFASNYEAYKVIKLSIDGFSFPPKFVEIGLSDKTALFHNISASQWFDNGDKNQRFTTSVGCSSDGITKVHVSLPNNVEIKTNLIIQPLSPENGIITEGRISYAMKNSALLRQSMISNNDSTLETNITQQMFYNRTSIDLEIDTQNHQFIYDKINSFIIKIESLMGNYLLNQLNAELSSRNATLTSSCLKLMKSKQPEKTTNSLLLSKFVLLNNLYVASGIKLQKMPTISLCIAQSFKPQFGHITTLNPGPVVVEGLSNFSNIEATFSFIDNLLKRKDYDKTMIIRIKSGKLNGKFAWNYDMRQNDIETNHNIEFIFNVDRVEIEIKINRYCKDVHCSKYQLNDPEIRVNLRKIRFTPPLPDTYCMHEGKLVEDVLYEYLESTIGESLRDSIARKINENQSLYVNSFNN